MSSCRQGYADTSSRASLRPQARPQRVRSPLLGRGRKADTPKDPRASGLAGSPTNGLHRSYPPSGKVGTPGRSLDSWQLRLLRDERCDQQ